MKKIIKLVVAITLTVTLLLAPVASDLSTDSGNVSTCDLPEPAIDDPSF